MIRRYLARPLRQSVGCAGLPASVSALLPASFSAFLLASIGTLLLASIGTLLAPRAAIGGDLPTPGLYAHRDLARQAAWHRFQTAPRAPDLLQNRPAALELLETARTGATAHIRAAASGAAARVRAAVLYGGSEFSSFPHLRPTATRTDCETVKWRPPLDSQAEDEWIALDKAKHLAFSFLWTLGTQYAAVNKGGISEHRALPLSITSSAVIGVTKEYYDLHVGPTRFFSMRDLVADAVGILLAVGVIIV